MDPAPAPLTAELRAASGSPQIPVTGRVCAAGSHTELVAGGTCCLAGWNLLRRGGEDSPGEALLGAAVLTHPGSVPTSVSSVPDSITSVCVSSTFLPASITSAPAFFTCGLQAVLGAGMPTGSAGALPRARYAGGEVRDPAGPVRGALQPQLGGRRRASSTCARGCMRMPAAARLPSGGTGDERAQTRPGDGQRGPSPCRPPDREGFG